MNGCPDDNMAAGIIAGRLSPKQQSSFDNMALKGAHEYIAELEANLAAREQSVAVAELKRLIVHMRVHANYNDAGYGQMTTEQKALYDSIWAESVAEADALEAATQPTASPQARTPEQEGG